MESSSDSVGDERVVAEPSGTGESAIAAISWAAIIGGAFAIAAIA